MAQQVEHVLGKDEVAGSNPANSSKENHQIWWFFLIFHKKYRFSRKRSQVQLHTIRYNCKLFECELRGRVIP